LFSHRGVVDVADKLSLGLFWKNPPISLGKRERRFHTKSRGNFLRQAFVKKDTGRDSVDSDRACQRRCRSEKSKRDVAQSVTHVGGKKGREKDKKKSFEDCHESEEEGLLKRSELGWGKARARRQTSLKENPSK